MSTTLKDMVLADQQMKEQVKSILDDIRKIPANVGLLVPMLKNKNRPLIVDTVLKPDPVTYPEEYRKHLDCVYDDKMYLERLFMDEQLRQLYVMKPTLSSPKNWVWKRLWIESINSGITNNGNILRKIIFSELNVIQQFYMHAREFEFWEKIQKQISKKDQNKRVLNTDELMDSCSKKIINLWKLYDAGKFQKVVSLGKQLLLKVRSWTTDEELGKRWFIQGDIIHIVGNALVDLYEFNEALEFFKVAGKLSDISGSLLYEKRHVDNMARMYSLGGLYDDAIDWYKCRSKYIANGEEKVWIDYEMALCYYFGEKQELAKKHVNLALELASKCKLYSWELNSYMLLSCICAALPGYEDEEVEMENLVSSVKAMENGLMCACKLNDTMRINVALNMLRHMSVAMKSEKVPMTGIFSPPMEKLLNQESTDRDRTNCQLIREALLFTNW